MASIVLNQVSVTIPIYNLSARSLKKQLLRFSTGAALNNDTRHVLVKALDQINLTIHHGDRVGLIGHNGAGKSTLLRVLAKIYEPTSGSLYIKGRVSPLLDVMLGINPESTGYENILIRGLLLGMRRKEIENKLDDIAAFTELGDYLYLPVRTYSSGMQLRLAFAVATSIQPEILLMDEVIGVGDAAFMEKAQQRLNRLMDRASIVVLASHSQETIKKWCNKVFLMEKGTIQPAE